jgi:hypothetical protein
MIRRVSSSQHRTKGVQSRAGHRTGLAQRPDGVSQHIFRKNGFVERFRVSYSEVLYEGKAVFTSIRGHDAAMLMTRA